jgi:DDE family transposase
VPYTLARYFARGQERPGVQKQAADRRGPGRQGKGGWVRVPCGGPGHAYGDQEGFRAEPADAGLPFVMALKPRRRTWAYGENARLFSHITMNWRGGPLTSHEVIVRAIAATTTRTGLRVHAELDPGSYDTGIQVSDA